MNFLSPALLFGLLAASIPVLIHLLNLRKLKKIDFSTLHFLKLIEKQKVRRVKLVQWLLMALRVLIIMMLVLGFSRPVLQETSIPGFTSAAKTSVVMIIDDSFSMEVVDGGGSLLNKAKGVADRIISGLKDGDDARVVLTSGRDEDAGIAKGDLVGLKKYIKELEPAFVAQDLNSAVIRAAKLMEESENLNKELYILSDLQRSTLGDPKEFTDISSLIDSRVKTWVIDLKTKKTVNSAVVGLKINNQVFEPGKEVSVTATIRNFSDDDINNGVVSLFLNDERGAQKSFSLEAGKITDVTLSAPVKKTGYSSVMVQIDEDDIKTDNQRYGSVYIPKEFNLLLLGKKDDVKFIRAAIEAGSFAGNMKITERDISQTGATEFTGVNMVIVSGSGENADLRKLKDFVNGGGGVLLFPGENTSLKGYSELLNGFGVPVPTDLKKDAKALPGKFASVSFNHPLLKEIFVTPYGNSVESPGLFTWFRLPAGGGVDIITLADGGSFLKETRRGKGKVLTIAAPPTLASGDLPLVPVFAPLVYRSLFYLASQEPAAQGTVTGEEISISAKRSGGGKIEVTSPGGLTSYLRTGTDSDGVRFDGTGVPGFYRFTRDDEEIYLVPVNTDSSESNTGYLADEELKAYFAAVKLKEMPKVVSAGEDFTQNVLEARTGSELWKLFLIFALILLAVEMYFARARKRDLA
ncbi:MAG: hypothetical protein HBSAPP04_07650 [Ignavibacteriaceae bacterium]|nr:MAG: hypothetical protein HBSAPP04_07650 [Ignavibacteriaceae bacterium]